MARPRAVVEARACISRPDRWETVRTGLVAADTARERRTGAFVLVGRAHRFRGQQFLDRSGKREDLRPPDLPDRSALRHEPLAPPVPRESRARQRMNFG